jgi:hypothetical protein
MASQRRETLLHMVLVAPEVTEQNGRDEVLTLLRSGPDVRPSFDHGLAGGLRAWLEDAASLVVQARGEEALTLHLGARQLIGGPEVIEVVGELPTAVVVACLVHALFRQIVVTGTVDDPMGDALSALRVDPRQRDVVQRVESMRVDDRRNLASVIEGHAGRLRTLTPRLLPGWMPRTGDHVSVPLAGGRVVLHGTFDLLIGTPSENTASLCAVGLTTTGPWERARHKLHLLALLEMLRSGNPPFRLALFDSGAGRFGIEDVVEEQLGAVASEVAERLAEVADAGH